jgi:WD40-like Beta Propeller Repeat
LRKISSLEKKKTRSGLGPYLALTMLAGGMLALVMTRTPSAEAQKYSDWSAPVNLGSTINSPFSDQGAAISRDGLSLYFTSDRPGGLGGPFDMYVSQRASVDDPWGAPMNLGPIVNTVFDEGNPAFSRDGHLLFFQSKRPGGLGGIDLWVSRREHPHDDFDWQPAVNLGPTVNSAADDNGPSYFENEEDGAPQLYFGSSRSGGLGAADIYLSEQLADGSFGPAVLVTELSSVSNENRPSIRHDGLEIFFQSNRIGSLGTALDLWVATRASTLDAWSGPVNLGITINTASIENNANLSSDGKTLWFSSDRPGGFGGLDFYMATRTKVRGQSGN